MIQFCSLLTQQGFIQQSSDEEAHVFNKTFIAKRLQFTIHEAESPFEDYYWRINLFVCLKSEGISSVYNHNNRTTSAVSCIMMFDIKYLFVYILVISYRCRHWPFYYHGNSNINYHWYINCHCCCDNNCVLVNNMYSQLSTTWCIPNCITTTVICSIQLLWRDWHNGSISTVVYCNNHCIDYHSYCLL